MRKIILLNLLLILSLLSIAQQKFPENLIRYDQSKPLIYTDQLGGGYWQVFDSIGRNAIPIAKRARGMAVSYMNSGIWVTKRFDGTDTTNAKWFNYLNWHQLGGASINDSGYVKTYGSAQKIYQKLEFENNLKINDTIEFPSIYHTNGKILNNQYYGGISILNNNNIEIESLRSGSIWIKNPAGSGALVLENTGVITPTQTSKLTLKDSVSFPDIKRLSTNYQLYYDTTTGNIFWNNPASLVDTTSLSHRIDLKLSKTDTLSMLTPYAKKAITFTGGIGMLPTIGDLSANRTANVDTTKQQTRLRSQVQNSALSVRTATDSTKRQSQVNTLSGRITTDSTKRQSQVNTLSGRITTDSTKRQTQINNVNTRAAGDSLLQWRTSLIPQLADSSKVLGLDASTTNGLGLYTNGQERIHLDGGSGTTTFGNSTVGDNLIVKNTASSELAPALTTGNYTLGTGWSYNTSPNRIEKLIDGTGTITPTAASPLIANTTYKVVIVVASISGGSLSYTMGLSGNTVTMSSATTYTDYITTVNTAKIVITPSVTGVRASITSISIIKITTGKITNNDLQLTGTINTYDGSRAIYQTSGGNLGIGGLNTSAYRLWVNGLLGCNSFLSNGTGYFGGNVTVGANITMGASSSIIAFEGTNNHSVELNRNTLANTAGNNFSIINNGATIGSTDKNGGDLIFKAGIGTGTGGSALRVSASTPGTTGTSDNPLSERLTLTGTGLGLRDITPSYLLSFGGDAANSVGNERNATGDGVSLTWGEGGCKSGSTGGNGGANIYKSQISTGIGTSYQVLQARTRTKASATKTTDNTLEDRLYIPCNKVLVNNTNDTLFSVALPTLTSANFKIVYGLRVDDATHIQSEQGEINITATNTGGTLDNSMTDEYIHGKGMFGTLTNTNDGTLLSLASNVLYVIVKWNSSITPSTDKFIFRSIIFNGSMSPITKLY